MNSKIGGYGYFVPERVVTNNDLSKLMDTNDAWIIERTGIKERRHLGKDSVDTTRTLIYKASMNALKKANLKAKDIDFILVATLSPDYYFPGNGVLLQQDLGCDTIGAMDVRNQCSGFIYALSTADAFIKTGRYKNILVVGGELQSLGLDLTDRGRDVSIIFGDGAGAVIVQPTEEEGKGILALNMHSEGENAEQLASLFPGTKLGWVDKLEKENHEIKPEEMYPYMNGPFVFKHAVTRFSETILEALKEAKLTIEDIDMLIPHQANLRISQFIQKKFNLSADRVFNNIQKYGNTTAASIPIALCEALDEGKIKDGDIVCLAAFGSGFTWGSIIMKW